MTLNQIDKINQFAIAIQGGLGILGDCDADDFARLAIIEAGNDPIAVIDTLRDIEAQVAGFVDRIVAAREIGDPFVINVKTNSKKIRKK